MTDRDTLLTRLSDDDYQTDILQDVSRTFALTIPQLPDPLCRVVSNAYLLCRIADTIEDDKHMSSLEKTHFAEQFIKVVNGAENAEIFSIELFPRLSPEATQAEKHLIANTESVIRITHGFNTRQRSALERCVKIMAEGMARYQDAETLDGVADLNDMGQYCYYVAGVVGEMLTELFCDYSSEIDSQRDEMMQLAVSFGQGLQMTNILKDIWEDHHRGACWMPRDIFANYGVDITNKVPGKNTPEFNAAYLELLGVARNHLNNALEYTLRIPKAEKGLRKFCLWAIGMAVLTLDKIRQHPNFTNGQEVKISRNSVKLTVLLTSMFVKQDKILRSLFNICGRNLPKQNISATL